MSTEAKLIVEQVKEWKFNGVLDFSEILKKLKILQPNLDWHMRDSEWYGDYLSGYCQGFFMRITDCGGGQYEFMLRSRTTKKRWSSFVKVVEKLIKQIQ